MDSATRTGGAVRVTAVGSAVNLVLTAVKLAAGFLGHSQAMIADAVHSLSDFATDIVVIFGLFAGSRPKDRSHRYGHGKFETLATTIVGLALIAVGIGILVTGARDIWGFFHGKTLGEPGFFPLIMAGVSIATKEALYRWTVVMAKKFNSQAMVANAWHHRSDALSSVGAGLGIAGAIFLGRRWHILDPIAAIVVSGFILRVGIQIIRKGIAELMESSLDEETERKILDIVEGVSGVRKPHNLKTRALGNSIAVDIHIRVEQNLSVIDGHSIANEVETRLRGQFGEEMHISVHVEPDLQSNPKTNR